VTIVAVLGLGEAGGAIAADLRAAGAEVRGYDVLPERTEAASAAEAISGADVVLSLTTAESALAAARSAMDALSDDAVYADANTGSVALKQDLAALLGAGFADVALMAPVPGRGVGTPALAAGPGAARFAAAFVPLGMPVEVLEAEAGAAARRKLLRSVAWKGIAAVVIEALAAGRAAGDEAFVRAQIAQLLPGGDIDRMAGGSRIHARRRVQELDDVIDQLRELGVQPRMTSAARELLDSLDG
jgi:3-hydroxyisobutyrate dehydrogenase-like beta-hydroxyacid dehydrogenase